MNARIDELVTELSWLDDPAQRHLCLAQLHDYREAVAQLSRLAELNCLLIGASEPCVTTFAQPSLGWYARQWIEAITQIRDEHGAFNYVWFGLESFVVGPPEEAGDSDRLKRLWARRNDVAGRLLTSLEAIERAIRNAGLRMVESDCSNCDDAVATADSSVAAKLDLESEMMPSDTVADPGYVTLSQAAPMVGKVKKTLENWRRDDSAFPQPDVKATKNGQANEWRWSTLRPYLECRSGRTLPERHPSTGVGF